MANIIESAARLLKGTAQFVSPPMLDRDKRLTEARSNANRCTRELRRDRGDLERKERSLLQQIKIHINKGDMNKAKMLAHQIVRFRRVCDRNFKGSVMIDTRAQLMLSNHKVNRAEVEAVKGSKYGNAGENLETFKKRYEKYSVRMETYEDMEELLNEGMDDIYQDAEEDSEPSDSTATTGFADDLFRETIEINSILRQALNPKQHREFVDRRAATLLNGSLNLHVVLYNSRAQAAVITVGATLPIPTLEISVDMLKRHLATDPYSIRQLHLQATDSTLYDAMFGSTKNFTLGRLGDNGDFEEFPFSASLRSLGIQGGDRILVRVDDK